MRALMVSGTALIAAAYGLARFGYGLFLPQFTETFDLGSTIAGVIQAGSFLAYCLAAMVAARMAAHPRSVVVAAGATAALGSAGVALAPSTLVFAVSVLAAGAGAGFATPGLVRLIERNVAPARQEIAQTIVNAGTGAGIVAAGVLMLLTIGRWRLGWAAIAVMAALATIATLRSDRAARSAHDVRPPRPLRLGDLAPLAQPLIAAALAGASSAAIWTFGRSVLAASRPAGEAYSILAWMVLGGFGLLGATAGKIVQTWSLRLGWTLTALTMAAATVLLGTLPHISLAAYTGVALFGASYTALSGVLIVWAVRLLPDRAAAGTVVLFVALAVGQAIGSVALGAVLGVASPGLAFALAGATAITALLPVVGPAAGRPSAVGGRARVTDAS